MSSSEIPPESGSDGATSGPDSGRKKRTPARGPLSRKLVVPDSVGRRSAPSLSVGGPLPPEDPRYLESRSRVYTALVWVEHTVAALLLSVLFALIVTQVVTRYVLETPLSWSEELARFIFIWFTFTAAAFVAARRKHITVLLYSGRRTGRVVSLIEGFATLVVIVVSIAMFLGSLSLMSSASQLVSPGTGIHLSVVYCAAAVGFGLIVLHSVLNLYLALRYPRQFIGMQDIEKAGI